MLKFGDDTLLTRIAIFIRITGYIWNTGYFGVFNGHWSKMWPQPGPFFRVAHLKDHNKEEYKENLRKK